MPGTIKGFFFDLDGTLVDTADANFEAYRIAIEDVTNQDLSRNDFNKTNGRGYRDFLPLLVPGISAEQIEDISRRKNIIYKEKMHLTRANSFLVDFLMRMAEHYTTVLVTTAKAKNAEIVLNEHGISNLFDYKIFGDDVTHMKPHPEAYLRALNNSNLLANEVVAFEDSEVGMKAASGAGISTIHIRSFL